MTGGTAAERVAALEAALAGAEARLGALASAAGVVLAMPRETDGDRNRCWDALLTLARQALEERG